MNKCETTPKILEFFLENGEIYHNIFSSQSCFFLKLYLTRPHSIYAFISNFKVEPGNLYFRFVPENQLIFGEPLVITTIYHIRVTSHCRKETVEPIA